MAVLNNKNNCLNCLFFTEGGHIGTCKRYPASVIKSPNEWCGEFKLFKRELEPDWEKIQIEPVKIGKLQMKFMESDHADSAVYEQPKKRGRPFKK